MHVQIKSRVMSVNSKLQVTNVFDQTPRVKVCNNTEIASFINYVINDHFTNEYVVITNIDTSYQFNLGWLRE